MNTSISDSKVGGKPIIRAWESFSGIYWLATELAYKQDSVINGEVYENDEIYFGFVTGPEPEWGYFSSTELKLLVPQVWELPKRAIAWLSKECPA
ncbi:Uncharacterised protein [Candidatus Tiddalikarchaeum anstoanum]|nr:Uncharacterised protein [Candidatus Tiddalikarchaeum anstoanum]